MTFNMHPQQVIDRPDSPQLTPGQRAEVRSFVRKGLAHTDESVRAAAHDAAGVWSFTLLIGMSLTGMGLTTMLTITAAAGLPAIGLGAVIVQVGLRQQRTYNLNKPTTPEKN